MPTKRRKPSTASSTDESGPPPAKRRRKASNCKSAKSGGKKEETEEKENVPVAIGMYNKWYKDRNSESLKVWEALKNKYNINKVLYCGSFIHISPSFYFDYTVYVDSCKNANKFFAEKNNQDIQDYIQSRRNEIASNETNNNANNNNNNSSNSSSSSSSSSSSDNGNDSEANANEFKFYYQDYNNDLKEEEENSFDLLVSLFAGFITDNNLKYVKKDGLILVNNSHNDAFNCYLKKDKVKLIGVMDTNGNIDDSDDAVNQCFVTSKSSQTKLVEQFEKKKHMKTIRFQYDHQYYIFKKI